MRNEIRKLILLFKRYLKSCNRKRKPCFLKVRSMLLLFLFVVFVEFLFVANHYGNISMEHFFAAIVPENLIEMTNKRRRDVDVEELKVNYLLVEAARMKAEDMAKKEYFAHTSPEGITPWHWFNKVGYNYSYAGENLAVNFREDYEVDEAWMKSPTHRDNIINQRFEEIGIATAVGNYKGKEAIFVVQLFGKPREVQAYVELPQENSIEVQEVAVVTEEIPQVLGEDLEKEEIFVNQEEKEVLTVYSGEGEERETFAFLENLNGHERYIIGAPEKVIRIEKDPNYISLWGKISSSPINSIFYLTIIMGVVFGFSFFLKLLLMKRIYLTFMIFNELTILLVIFSALVVSHYTLFLANYL